MCPAARFAVLLGGRRPCRVTVDMHENLVAARNRLLGGASARSLPGAANPAEVSSEILNNRRLFSGVVAGIAHYGNCFGIPTLAGEVYFDPSYEGNPLVNAFCLGVLRHDQIVRGRASIRSASLDPDDPLSRHYVSPSGTK